MMTEVYNGLDCRVQLKVIDLTGDDVPVSIRTAYPTFGVYTLPDTADRNTAFVRGTFRYYGNDAQEAWLYVRIHAPGAGFQISPRMKKYMTRWGVKLF